MTDPRADDLAAWNTANKRACVVLPWSAPPITQNGLRRMHHHAEAIAKRQALTEARWAIRNAHITNMARATVVLNWQMKDMRRRDGDGAAPTLKVCLDALVDEGVLEDDSWPFVPHSGVTCHPPIKGQLGAMWLALTPIGDAP